MNIRPITIYALTTAADDYLPRYVGKTIALPRHRLAQHMRDAERGLPWRVYRWVRSRVAAGHEIIMLSLERDAPHAAVELTWIEAMRRRGCILMNSIDGGNTKTSGGTLTDEHRAKIKAGMLKSNYVPKRGYSHSDEHKAAISRGLLASGRDYTEQGKKISVTLTGRKLSPEHIASLRAAVRPTWSADHRAAFEITNASPETIALRRESALNRSRSPEQRALLAEKGRLGAAKRWGRRDEIGD